MPIRKPTKPEWRDISDSLQLYPARVHGEPSHLWRAKLGISRKQLLRLSTTWGIAHLGYQNPRAHKTLQDIAEGKDSPLLPLVSSQWYSKAKKDHLHKYSLVIWKPIMFNKNDAARITIAGHQPLPIRRLASDSLSISAPYFNSQTAQPAEFNELLRCTGMPLWTKETQTEDQFSEALASAIELMGSPSELDILFALLSQQHLQDAA